MLGIIFAAFLATADHGCPQYVAADQAPAAAGLTQICEDGYALGYDRTVRGARWSAEHLTPAGAKAALAAKRAGKFHPEALLARQDRAELSDYRCQPYDRGHLTPVGDKGDPVEEGATFSLANMIPQVPSLNEGVWAGIEGAQLQLAAHGDELYIVTGPRYAPNPPLMNGRVAIPAATWKAIYDATTGKAWVYVAPNDTSGTYYVETVGALAAQIGFDPFPGLADAVKSPPAAPDAPKPTKGSTQLPPRTCG